jgi:radical SAM superfamily enzyme YgiQ (UPF0313 family)
MIMKVLLAAVNAKFIHSNLAVRYLKAYTEDIDYDCCLMEFSINDRREKVLEALVMEKPDVVAFSCYIWNIEYVKYLSSHIRLVCPECIIMYGGPEVSFDSEQFLSANAGDFVIEGEGEEAYRELILRMLRIGIKRENIEDSIGELNIRGLYTKAEGQIHYGGKRGFMNMDRIAFPYDELSDIENKIVYYEASRGCPFNCKYCLSSTSHGVRFHDIERVKTELAYFVGKGVKLVKFVDRTFNCNREFAMGIWDFLITLGGSTRFHFEISADILSDQELALLRRAPVGLFQFEVGVQTTNNDVLRNINRNVNFEDIREKVCELEKIRNIKQHLDLIAGLPGEDFASFRLSFNDVFELRPEEIQLGFLKLLKGSQMRDEADDWGMIYSPEPPYEILKTRNISYGELVLLKRVEEVVDKYYNSGKFEDIINYFIPLFESPFDFFYELGEFFHRRGLFSKNISSADYYKVFIEFFDEYFSEDNLPLKEIIKFDYLKFNRKRWLPEFLLREISKDKERKIKAKRSKNIHVEKYFIDILGYLDKGEISKGEFYLTYDDENDKIEGVPAAELQDQE